MTAGLASIVRLGPVLGAALLGLIGLGIPSLGSAQTATEESASGDVSGDGTASAEGAEEPASEAVEAPQQTNAPAPATEAVPTSPPVLDAPASDTAVSDAPVSDTPEEEDSSTNVFWLEGRAGAAYVDLVQFQETNFLPGAARLNGVGFSAAAAAGIRLYVLTLGARGTLSTFDEFDIWTVAADVGLRIPTPVLEIYARVGFGYAWLGSANLMSPSNSDASVFGLVLDAGVGFDIYLSDNVAIGAGIEAAFLNLSRQRIDQTGCGGVDCTVLTINFEEDGDATGLSLRGLANLRLEL